VRNIIYPIICLLAGLFLVFCYPFIDSYMILFFGFALPIFGFLKDWEGATNHNKTKEEVKK